MIDRHDQFESVTSCPGSAAAIPSSGRWGVTLMELLVASALLALLLGGLWGLVDIFTSLGHKGREHVYQINVARGVLHQFSQDLRGVPSRQSAAAATSVLRGNERSLEFWSIQAASLQFVETLMREENDPYRHRQEFEFHGFQDGPGRLAEPSPAEPNRTDWDRPPREEMDLHRVRYVYIPFDFSHYYGTTTPFFREDEQPATHLHAQRTDFPDVENVRFSYYDGARWRRSWDSRMARQLPVAVQLKVWLYGGSVLAPRHVDERDRENQFEDNGLSERISEDGAETTDTRQDSEDYFSGHLHNMMRADSLPERPADLSRIVFLRFNDDSHPDLRHSSDREQPLRSELGVAR